MTIAQHTEKNFETILKWINKNHIPSKTNSSTILGRHERKICLKKSSPPKYNGEETVKIKGLHYVNQWQDTQKTFTILVFVVQGRLWRSYVLQENVKGILVKPVYHCKGLS